MRASLTRRLALSAALASCCGAAFAANQLNPRARSTPVHLTAPTVPRPVVAASANKPPSTVRQVTVQREQFLNLLTQNEDKLISAQARTLSRVARLSSFLDRVDSLLLLKKTARGALLQLAQTLLSTIRLDYSRLVRNTVQMRAGLNREVFVLGRILNGEPTAAERARYQLLIFRQAQEVNALGRHSLTPINP